MSVPIREYLAQRRADIQAQIKALRAELAEVDVAERALLSVNGEAMKGRRERGTGGSGKKTLKEMAVEVLQNYPDGLEAANILSEIEKKYGVTVQRESLSPQLSRLGQDEVLKRDGLIWKLAQFDWTVHPGQPRKIETPDAATSGASRSEEDFDDEILF